ncbi:MAG: FHA domain-containing protein, partial [Planctomycetales bacterium]|nr:FHA domain-containing protein [Planctomycetales bacterium]
MKVIIQVTQGEFSGRKIALRSPVLLSIGRTAAADYPIPHDGQLSGIHFELELEAHGAFLRDRESRNGTFVNGNPVSFCPLNDGDSIRAGNTTFSIRFEEPPVQLVSQPSSAAAPAALDSRPPIHESSGTVAADAAGEFNDQPLKASAPKETAPPEKERDAEIVERPAIQKSAAPAAGAAPRSPSIAASLPFERAFDDESPTVVKAALEAAAWTSQPWLLDYCRNEAAAPRVERLPFLEMLAILAEPSDLSTIHRLALNIDLGWQRMRVVGLYGHPELLPLLIESFAVADKRIAVAAGQAFQKIVGGDFESQDRVTLPPEDGSEPDEFDAEFLEQEYLPDANAAKRYLQQHRSELNEVTRCSRGIDVSQAAPPNAHIQLDLESRWEAAMRSAYRQ